MHRSNVPPASKRKEWVFMSKRTAGSLIQFQILHGNESLRNYHSLSFGVVSKNIFHDILEKLLKYTSLFQLNICRRLDFRQEAQARDKNLGFIGIVDDYLKLHEVSKEVSIYEKKVQVLSSGLRSGHKKSEEKTGRIIKIRKKTRRG